MKKIQICTNIDGGNDAQRPAAFITRAKWGWAVRALVREGCVLMDTDAHVKPHMGDVILARIRQVGNHTRINMTDRRFSRLYEGDTIVGVVGYRYATDAFHAPTVEMTDLHLLTNAGLCGTVKKRHASIKAPTQLDVLGFLGDSAGKPVNLIDRLFNPRRLLATNNIPVILVVGTGMNSGKTTVTSRVSQALVAGGLRVAILKLTGSVSHRDLDEFGATGAVFNRDFSDYGFPSTYRVKEHCLLDLFQTMIVDAQDAHPDLILSEIADGVLQQETQMLLQSSLVSQTVAGVLLSATCALSAMALIRELHCLGYSKLAVSGKITNASLFVEELQNRANLPVFDCFGEAGSLADAVLSWIESPQHTTMAKLSSMGARVYTDRIKVA